MDNTALIECDLRCSRGPINHALGLVQVAMRTYLNGVDTMAAKTSKKKSTRQKPPADETPAGAFKRLATGRVNKALKSIGLIAQLTGTAYESTDVEKRAIVTALKASVEQVEQTFAGTAKASDKFKLPGS